MDIKTNTRTTTIEIISKDFSDLPRYIKKLDIDNLNDQYRSIVYNSISTWFLFDHYNQQLRECTKSCWIDGKKFLSLDELHEMINIVKTQYRHCRKMHTCISDINSIFFTYKRLKKLYRYLFINDPNVTKYNLIFTDNFE